MKNIYSRTMSSNKELNLQPGLVLVICLMLLITFLFGSCKKDIANTPEASMASIANQGPITEANALNSYNGLSFQTLWELQQARAASARYRNFDNATADGYQDINVIVPEMGHHYLKMANLDINFDYKKPELLVYNREHDGSMKLVAVEYAVPIDLTPTTAPAGFTGNADVWDRNTFFGLWLLHAWVWEYNPNGVFNPTNPEVHVH